MTRRKKTILSILIIGSVSLAVYLFFIIYGPPINKEKLINRVEDYLIAHGENPTDIKEMEVKYHWTTNYYVAVTYKDEPNITYQYTYMQPSNSNKKTIIFHYHGFTDGTSEDGYKYKHLHTE